MSIETDAEAQGAAISLALQDVTDGFSAPRQPSASFEAVDTAIERIFGRCYTTILLVEGGIDTCRIFSTVAQTYPVGVRKSLPDTERTRRLVKDAIPFVANSLKEIAAAYPDHDTVRELGAVNLVNLPIVFDAQVVGLLCIAGSDEPRDASFSAKARPFAQVLAPVLAMLLRERTFPAAV